MRVFIDHFKTFETDELIDRVNLIKECIKTNVIGSPSFSLPALNYDTDRLESIYKVLSLRGIQIGVLS